ncbi:hypothetical protein Q9233_015927 [Columba guinea]|nr:hypothetical protein Q9233_015927 [Columba guinea]
MSGHVEHLVNGMEKLKAAAFQVEDLKSKLASQEAELQLKYQDAEPLIAKIGFQTEKVSQEKAIADAEEQKILHDVPLIITYPITTLAAFQFWSLSTLYGSKTITAVITLVTAIANSKALIQFVMLFSMYEVIEVTHFHELLTYAYTVLDSNLCKLTASLEEVVAEKVQRQDYVNQTNKTIELTNRLVRRLEVRRFFLDVLATVNFEIFEMFC